MRLGRVGSTLAIFAIPLLARAKVNDPPPTVTVSGVTWTIAELTIQPSSPSDGCVVSYGENFAGPNWVRARTLAGNPARIVGLRPGTRYHHSVSCEGSHEANGMFRTLATTAALPPPPQIIDFVLVKDPAPLSVTASAKIVPPGGVPTACWFEYSKKALGPYIVIDEADCSKLGFMALRRAFDAGDWVRFVMRNATIQLTSTAIRVPTGP